jgi:hypothetical protein
MQILQKRVPNTKQQNPHKMCVGYEGVCVHFARDDLVEMWYIFKERYI